MPFKFNPSAVPFNPGANVVRDDSHSPLQRVPTRSPAAQPNEDDNETTIPSSGALRRCAFGDVGAATSIYWAPGAVANSEAPHLTQALQPEQFPSLCSSFSEGKTKPAPRTRKSLLTAQLAALAGHDGPKVRLQTPSLTTT
jgi:hypothetical protein